MQLEYRTHTVLGSDESKAEAFAHLKSAGNNVCIRLVQKEEKGIFEHTVSTWKHKSATRCSHMVADL